MIFLGTVTSDACFQQVIKERRAQETEMFLLSCAVRMNLTSM